LGLQYLLMPMRLQDLPMLMQLLISSGSAEAFHPVRHMVLSRQFDP